MLLFLHGRPEQQELVFRCFNAARANGVGAPEVEELIQVLEAAGVIAEAEVRGKSLIADARAIFTAPASTTPLSEEGRALLAGLIDLIG